jgi:hypothetical protein
MIKHTLKVAGFVFVFAGKCNLRFTLFQLVKNLAVGHIAHLVILFHHETLCITNASFAIWHHRVASIVCFANVAVDSIPSIFAIAVLVLARSPVDTIGERATGWG